MKYVLIAVGALTVVGVAGYVLYKRAKRKCNEKLRYEKHGKLINERTGEEVWL
jgi:hypothetical protein